MHAKCGRLEEAQTLFEDMPHRDLFTWNSMIVALGIHGRGDEAGEMMSEEFSLRPGVKHYGCVVDLLGRAGELERALCRDFHALTEAISRSFRREIVMRDRLRFQHVVCVYIKGEA
ncbi:unnamed protein product [Spirodela intermedia]|uniref:DYW domain-containing protein n=1 Tax=Spirodela intermedia TaxID=51605 RepID=A0A7I8IW76_SPIIN|nr:unnamed protein product [Spirodela intermedia]CAA6662228.1 unnamed protein product [Spirodela intermedia]